MTDAANLDEAKAQITELTVDLDKAEHQLKTLSAALVDRQLVTAEDADKDGFDPVTLALKSIDGGSEDLAKLQRQLKAQKGATTKVKNALENAQELVREQDAGPRDIAPIKLAKGKQPFNARELLELIGAAEKVEVVASDGAQEVMTIKPLEVKGTLPWRVTAVGLQLGLPVWLVHGPKAGDPPYQLAGWGLVLDGELVAYRARPRTLQMGGGQQYNLGGDVIF